MKDYKVVIYLNGKKVAESEYIFDKEGAEKAVAESKQAAERSGMNGFDYKAVRKLNAHEKVVARLVQDAVSEYIGGYANALEDYSEDTEEYKEAAEFLGNHDKIVEAIYKEVMANSDSNAQSHIRFAGKAFIMSRIEARVEKEGY